ncbi:MAG TPA: amidohydrolase family protein, partial [Solirubrobacteraceae bacterium]|nr:amidohydrolase family protein [Solirubrobacteraceae bacterium]
MRADLIAVARGDREPDLVISGAHVFSGFTGEWLHADVAVSGGVIAGLGEYEGGERVDASGQYLVPGFIDAHVHIESSKLVPAEFARAVVPHGTTAVITDPHELANVLGPEGVQWMLEASEDLPLDVFVMAPSCVPASHFESPGCAFEPADMEAILRHPRALGIAEMMNFPGVIAGDETVLARFEVPGSSHIDGHAPGVTGLALNAYVAAGIRSDHEATTYDEALEKRRAGMWVLIREASNAHNLRDLLPIVKRYGPEHCAFCTDDREPDLLYREGHIDQMCRIAVQEGIRPEHALLMATLHPARAHGLMDRGAVAPGLRADLALLDDLETFRPACVWKDGRLVAVDGRPEPFAAAAIPDHVRRDHPRQHVRVARDDAREVHHLGHAERPRVAQDRPHLVRPERSARRLEVAGRNARRRHHEHVERQALGRVQHPLDALAPEHVGDLVRVGDHRGRPVRHDRARELRRHELRRLDVHVRVDEPRHEPAAARIDAFAAVVRAEAGDAAAGHGHVEVEPLACERGEDARVLDHQVGRLVAARDR